MNDDKLIDNLGFAAEMGEQAAEETTDSIKRAARKELAALLRLAQKRLLKLTKGN